MLDIMNEKTNTLNCIIHSKICLGGNKTALLFKLSPKKISLEILLKNKSTF